MIVWAAAAVVVVAMIAWFVTRRRPVPPGESSPPPAPIPSQDSCNGVETPASVDTAEDGIVVVQTPAETSQSVAAGDSADREPNTSVRPASAKPEEAVQVVPASPPPIPADPVAPLHPAEDAPAILSAALNPETEPLPPPAISAEPVAVTLAVPAVPQETAVGVLVPFPSPEPNGAPEVQAPDHVAAPPIVVAVPAPVVFPAMPQPSPAAESPPVAGETPAMPSRYRPPSQTAPAAKPRASRLRRKTEDSGSATLPVRVLAAIDRAGRFDFSLLFERPDESPSTLPIRISGKTVMLEARDDDWYEALQPENLHSLLSAGFAVSANLAGTSVRWQLSSGRTFLVFAHETGLGWVNQPRVRLGVRQFVATLSGEAVRVCAVLAESCTVPVPATETPSLPGWTIVGQFTPASAPPALDADPLGNVLRPLPNVSILLDDGLWLRGSEWLEGFGPRIRLSGILPAGGTVHIDGIPAAADTEGVFTTASSHTVGFHTIQCPGTSTSYSIVPPPAEWDAAPESADGLEDAADVEGSVLVSVPASNPILIGAHPGEYFLCTPRAGAPWTGYIRFRPVWALPDDPAHSDRHSARVMARETLPVQNTRAKPGQRSRQTRDVLLWCSAILASQRKGLVVAPHSAGSLWETYTKEAGLLRRERR